MGPYVKRFLKALSEVYAEPVKKSVKDFDSGDNTLVYFYEQDEGLTVDIQMLILIQLINYWSPMKVG